MSAKCWTPSYPASKFPSNAAAPTTCALTAAAPPATVSYAEDIAPMLIDNCVTCHREGGIGPWAMTGYNMVRGFAPMIREVVRTKRMPPWHADPAHGVFTNDRSLSTDEVRTLVHWVETGAPRGDGPDPLATLDAEWPDWGLANRTSSSTSRLSTSPQPASSSTSTSVS